MSRDFIKLFKGNPITVMAVIDVLDKVGIVPIVKNPSESARLAGFGFMTSEQSIWVHTDEKNKAVEVLKSLEF
ncbi:DUF2007 domain-containing protein [Flavobacteriaceae bacterium]|jgi:hypothetical protein|nr:DUF2007 domain-containing protein [Flavobacteriaceae bacterium]